MNVKQWIYKSAVIMVILLMSAMNGYAQSMDELIDQLCGKAESPERNSAQLTEAYERAVNYLVPLMANEDVDTRYNAQITVQNMGSYAARPGAEPERKALANVMIQTIGQRGIPATVQHWLIQQIGRIGMAESVPTLAKLMAGEDSHLSNYARQALETNPDPSATTALTDALTSADDPVLKLGLLNSLGLRGDPSAVPQIIDALNDENEMIASAAATALSNIGGISSIEALSSMLETPSSPIYVKAAKGLVDIAQKMIATTDYARAASIFWFFYANANEAQAARDPGAPDISGIRAASVSGLIVCSPNDVVPRMAEFIQDEDPMVRAAVVNGASITPNLAPTEALVELLPALEPDTQVQILALAGDKGETSTISGITPLLNSDNETVCIAAIHALSEIGSEAAALALMEAAVMLEGDTRDAARQGLAVVTGTGVETFIQNQARSGNANTRVVAIPLLGKRQSPGAVEALYGYAAEKDENIQTAAFQGLTELTGSVDIATLIELIAKTKNEKPRDAGLATLRSVLSATRDKDDAAEIMASEIDDSKKELKPLLLSTLDALGGLTALDQVNNAATSSDETMKDAGIRTMSEWPDFEAAGKLLAIASQSNTSLTHYVLATRGIVRLIQNNPSVPVEESENLCLSALNATRRNEEKIQIISAMGSIPTLSMSERLLELAKDDNLKVEAGLALVRIASSMQRSEPEASQELAQKILGMDISDDVNGYAQSIISGERVRFGGFGGGR
ncbi:HEAT repeat domain-containing protein [bacterium]|nr:HEAT repeat domain-containing protein [bacterium]